MRGLLAAIRNVLRAMRRAAARMKEVTVMAGGKLISMLIPGAEPVEPDEPVAVEAAPVDDFGDRVRKAAGSMMAAGIPDPDLLATLPQSTVRWLSLCDDEMLKAVMRSSDEAIRDHIRGRKSIRGVLCADEESVDQYVRSLMDRPDAPQEEVRQHMAWVPA